MVRFTVVYLFGGLYFDLDVFFLQDFSPLFAAPWARDCLVVYAWETQPFPNTAVMFALAPKSPVVLQSIDLLSRRSTFITYLLHYELLRDLRWTVIPCP